MPFKSKAQVRKLAKTRPALFKRWKRKYGIPRNLPERVSKRKRVRRKGRKRGHSRR